jgi:hypothetical protein
MCDRSVGAPAILGKNAGKGFGRLGMVGPMALASALPAAGSPRRLRRLTMTVFPPSLFGKFQGLNLIAGEPTATG